MLLLYKMLDESIKEKLLNEGEGDINLIRAIRAELWQPKGLPSSAPY